MVNAIIFPPLSIVRQPLQEIPATPLDKRPTPLYIVSSPSVSPCVPSNLDQLSSHPTNAEILTPPPTPLKRSRASDHGPVLGVSKQSETYITRIGNSASETVDTNLKIFRDHLSWAETQPKPYKRKYKLLGSASAGYEEFGRGVWSAVYCAEEVLDVAALSSPLTPPSSPLKAIEPTARRQHLLVAIKAPIRRDAYQVLENEAKILTYLHQKTVAKDHVIGFHGYDSVEHAICLEACPLTLATHCASALSHVRKNFVTKTMFDPVIGAAEWTELTKSLVGGLEFLHGEGCVHGDIKPANILLRTASPTSFHPLYCDFSSSHVIYPEPSTQTEEVNAVTADFTSPELLASFYHRNSDRAVATLASDVFALGVTLLVAATGESPYAGARMEMQKLSMTKEGIPLEYARSGDQASRVIRGKMVDRVLSKALIKDGTRRISAADWIGVANGLQVVA